MKEINIQTETKTGTMNPVYFPPDVNEAIAAYMAARRRYYGKIGMNKGQVLIIAFRHGGVLWLRDQTNLLNTLADQGKKERHETTP